MEKITEYKGHWWIVALIIIALGLIIFLGIFCPSASADVLIFGSTPNYSAVILPNNSYVMQGENISQGNHYDLRGVYGFSGELAHWNNDNSAGQGNPDQIVTLKGYGITFIDPVKFPVGRWWQWDGNYCPTSSDTCTFSFGHGNAYVFYVTPGQQGNNMSVQERVIVQSQNITIFQNGESIQIPVTYTQVETYYGTPIPTSASSGSGTITLSPTEIPIPTFAGPINPDVQDRNGVSIPGGVGGAMVVTQKSPIPILVPMFAVIMGLFVMRRKE
jgi:hypothetical protein